MTRKLWVPALVGLLVAALVGPTVVTAAEPRLTTKTIMVPAAAFIPTTDNSDYGNEGLALWVGSSYGNFTAPLSFPVPVVNIKKITLYALDDNAGAGICATLYRARPADASDDSAGQVCTTNASAPQSPYTTTISPRRVNTGLQGPYLWVNISGPSVWLYGVKVTYSYEA